MPDDDQFVTRREFDQAHADASREHARLDQNIRELNDHGSRGVLQLQDQVTTLVRDVGKLEVALTAHENSHTIERSERSKNRKWIVTTSIAVLLLMVTAVSMMAAVLLYIHK